MFDDSNASFKIPETQADPPRKDQEDDMADELNIEAFVAIPDEKMPTSDAAQSHDMDDELNSEAFVAIPDEEMPTSDARQSHDMDDELNSEAFVAIPDEEMPTSDAVQSHDMDEELNSEAFAAIPDEEMPTSDPAQSQDLQRGGVFLLDSQVNVTHESDVDKTTSSKGIDAIDLEMSKLEWNDHDTGKEEDDPRRALVTPDLDFDILSSTKVAGADNDKSASVIPDFDFDLLTRNLLPQFSKSNFKSSDEDLSYGMDRKEVENDSPTISKLEVDRPEAVALTEVETRYETKANGYEEQADTTQKFTKPTKITKNPVAMEIEMEATQLSINPTSSRNELKKINSSSGNEVNEGELLNQSFTNPASSSIENMKIDNKDEIKNADLDETQLFVKSNDQNGEIGHEEDEINDGATHKAKVRKSILPIVSFDEDDSDDDLVKIDRNAENINRIISLLDKEESDVKTDEEHQKPFGIGPEGGKDDYNAATQIFEVKKLSNQDQLLRPSDAEDDDVVVENDERMEKTNGMDAESTNVNKDNENDIATQEFEFRKPKAHKRNHLISSSDEENDSANLLTPMRVESPLPTKSLGKKNKKSAETTVKIQSDEKLEDDTSPTKTLESQKYDFMKDLEGADWSQLCDEANTKQSNVTYINDFDQSKELRIRVQNKLSTTSPVVKNDVDLKNVNGNEEIQINTTNLGNVRKSSRSRKKTGNSESSATSDAEIKTSKPKKSRNNTPTPEILPSSSKSSTIVTEPDDVNGDIEMQATQAFVKASSSTNKSTIDASNRPTRKRKAATEVFPVDESVDEAYSSLNCSLDISDSVSRTSRNNNFRVMFTMIDPEPYKSLLKQLNVSIVSADDNYNALITDRVYRTKKFMCALASGKPIVSTNWLDALKKSKSIPDPLKFLLNDKVGEEKYKFCLAKTICDVGKSGGLFRNHSILVTPNTKPGPDVFKDIVFSGGGKYLKTTLKPRKGDQVLCVSVEKDKNMWERLKKKYHLKDIITVETFLNMIFNYNMTVNDNKMN